MVNDEEIQPEIVVSEPQEFFISSFAPRNLFLSGTGSGKSHGGGLISANFIIHFPQVRGFIGANTYGQLSKSTLDRIFNVWGSVFGWQRDVHYVVDKVPPPNFKIFNQRLKSYENTISFDNGCLIFLASLDNYKMIDGTEFAWAILDETKDTKEEAVKEVITMRLRQPGIYHDLLNNELTSQIPAHGLYKALTPLYVLTSPAKVAWINEWFELIDHYQEINNRIFDKNDFFKLETNDLCVVISSTYHNEANLPKDFIEGRIKMLQGNKNLVDMLIYGSPIAKNGGEFIKTFSRLKHVKKLKRDVSLPYHITLDFNVRPYMTCVVAQVEVSPELIKLKIIREYCLADPQNRTEDIASHWIVEFGKNSRGLFYYGDPSGGNENTLTKEYRDNYDALAKFLARYLNNNSNRVLHNHPAVLTSRDFLNALFAGGAYPIEIEIDESCKNLINDLEFCMEDHNGKMLKPIAKDPITGKTYEKMGHCLDSLRYLICKLFEDHYASR